jgi:hypothetical protein
MHVDSVRKVPRCAVFGDHVVVFSEINEIKRVGIECLSLNERVYVNSILIIPGEDKLACSAIMPLERTKSYPHCLRILLALGQRDIAAPISLEK